MDYHCVENDPGMSEAKSLGAPWTPIEVRYNGPPKWTPGCAWMLDDDETKHWWLGLPWKGGAKQADAIAHYQARLAETRAACPAGTPLVLYATPCKWGAIAAAKVPLHVDHWCWVGDTLGTDEWAMCMYDIYADANAADGDELADEEVDFQRKRLELGVAVAEKSGKPLHLMLWHRQKGLGKSPMGRILTCAEVEPVIGLVNEHKSKIASVVFWQGDHAASGYLCNPAVKMNEQARIDLRADWQAETWHPDEVPTWTMETIKRVQHTAAANRRAFAGWVYCGTRETT